MAVPSAEMRAEASPRTQSDTDNGHPASPAPQNGKVNGSNPKSHHVTSPLTEREARSGDERDRDDDMRLSSTREAKDEGDHAEEAADAVERDQKRSGSSRLNSPTEDATQDIRKKSMAKSPPVGATQTAAHLPVATDAAMQTFAEIKSNAYQNNKVGRSKGYEKEAMTCECHYRHGIDDPSLACSEDAGCINRLTQVECRESDCNCGRHCQNQRFQKQQYANVNVVQTEKKGFGLRAEEDLTADSFIYEYIGEVVEQNEFMDRMQRYKMEGIRHYYFMMLQREEFLDATKRGGIARFINHSCNPNCYVSKWHVGKFMRMGIFSKRDIQKGEELTFNYNVDRYGNEAQMCYCGEPNCVGSIGGKTQTDIGGMDQLFIDALGIADEVNRLDARGTRRKKSRHLDEDYTPTLRPMEIEEVNKVMTAVRQATSNRPILQKLLSRIQMTDGVEVQRSLVRLHGLVLLAGIIDEWKDDKEILSLILSILDKWPLLAKNKVVDSGIDKIVNDLTGSDDDQISRTAKGLLQNWDGLQMSYRIARREGNGTQASFLEHRRPEDVEDVKSIPQSESPLSSIVKLPDTHDNSRSASRGPPQARHNDRSYQNNDRYKPQTSRMKHSNSPRETEMVKLTPATPQRAAISIEEIIRKANEATAQQRRAAEEAAKAAEEVARAAEAKSKSEDNTDLLSIGMKRTSSDKAATRTKEKRRRTGDHGEETGLLEVAERRLKRLVGEVVVQCMSLYKKDLDRDSFKKHAKELTGIISDKEKRNPKLWPPKLSAARSEFLPDGLSSEKKGKIRDFATSYVRKLVAHKVTKHSTALGGETPASTSQSIDTPRENDQIGNNSSGDILSDEDSDGEESDAERIEDAADASPPSSLLHGQKYLISDKTSGSAASTSTNVSDSTVPVTPQDVKVAPPVPAHPPTPKKARFAD